MSRRLGRSSVGHLVVLVGCCASAALAAVQLAGCGGGDDRPDIAVSGSPEPIETTAPASSASSTAQGETPTAASSEPIELRATQRREIRTRATETATAISRWDHEFAECVGPTGEGDDSDATCTHAAWEQLVDQVEIEMYYFLEELRAMPRGPCHDALAAENDILRAFWHGAAPLDLAWLDEQQRPPSRFDLDSAVAILRPVPRRIEEAVVTVCAR
jgi:hypothetical protein